jgi:hypothetical protein
MAVGHAIIASDRVGCVGPTDAARPGRNALTYRVGDISALASALEELIESKPLRQRMSRASLALAATQDIQKTAAAVLGAITALQPNFAVTWRDISPDILESLQSEQSRLEAISCR